MFEKMAGIARKVLLAPGKFIESLDGEGQTTEQMGGIGTLGSKMAERLSDPRTPIDGD